MIYFLTMKVYCILICIFGYIFFHLISLSQWTELGYRKLFVSVMSKHIITLPIKTITWVLKVLRYIIISISACRISGLCDTNYRYSINVWRSSQCYFIITDCDLYFSVLRLMEDHLSNHLVGGKVRFIYIYCLV